LHFKYSVQIGEHAAAKRKLFLDDYEQIQLSRLDLGEVTRPSHVHDGFKSAPLNHAPHEDVNKRKRRDDLANALPPPLHEAAAKFSSRKQSRQGCGGQVNRVAP